MSLSYQLLPENLRLPNWKCFAKDSRLPGVNCFGNRSTTRLQWTSFPNVYVWSACEFLHPLTRKPEHLITTVSAEPDA